MRLLRVFPERTSHTPKGRYVQIGEPDLLTPRDMAEVHISCAFTWYREECLRLAAMYKERYSCPVRVGGPAFASPVNVFAPGRYIDSRYTLTSRGCLFGCPWCLVPAWEGNWRALPEPWHRAPNVQDNNVLIGGPGHWRKVLQLLAGLRGVRFVGGLDARLLKDWHVNGLQGLKIREVWLAYDAKDAGRKVQRAIEMLSGAGLGRNAIRCYVLAGFQGEALGKAEDRAREVFAWGGLPFAQLYLSPDASGRHDWPTEARRWQRRWTRPAAVKAMCSR